MQGYDFRPIETGSGALSECAALLRAVLSPSLDHRYLSWLYAENPAGTAVGYNAFQSGTLAAHYATIPLVAHVNGRIEKGLLSLNTATHPDHQGRGLFPTIAAKTYERAAELGFGFVIGVANARSTRGFVEKLGFQLVAPLDVRVGVGAFESTAEDAARSYAPVWSEAAIAWRLRRPGARYFAGPRRGSTCDAFANIAKFGILAHLGRVPAMIAADLPRAAVWNPLRMQIGLDRAARRKGFSVRVPDRLKPSPLNLIFHDVSGAGRSLDAEHVRWSLLDFDAY
jgi:GNAT superfamily N-acetyltransferase